MNKKYFVASGALVLVIAFCLGSLGLKNSSLVDSGDKTPSLAAVSASLFPGVTWTFGNEWYVTPTGSSSGNGSMANPWNLQTVLNHPSAVKPGDIIWVKGGTYVGSFNSKLNGTLDKPIIVRAYPGERATLDAATPSSALVTNYHTLYAGGSYTWFWGLEITNSNLSPRSISAVYNNYRGDGIWSVSPGTKFINMTVHDTDQGFSWWEGAINSEIYGTVIYNNGWQDSMRGRGHNVYAQNKTGTKLLKDSFLIAGYDHGIQVYGSENAYLDNMVLEGNIAYSNVRNYLIGGQGNRPALNPVMKSNFSYQPPAYPAWDGGGAVNLGYSAGCSNPVVTDNYFGFGGLRFVSCSNITMTGNTFYGATEFYGSSVGQTTANFPNNTYYNAATRPPVNKVAVRPNTYESGRANIVIYNWQSLNNVSVDISGIGLNVGDTYELHNAANYYGDVTTAVWNGGPISISMSGHTVASRIGASAVANTFPTFGAFVIQKRVEASSPLPPITPPTPPTPEPTPTPTPAPTPTPSPVSCGSPSSGSFTGCYYNGTNFSNLIFTRNDAAINFDWGVGSPDALVPVNTWSARWQGNFNFAAGNYTFNATTDDGMKLLVDGNLVINKWQEQPPSNYSANVALTAGTHLVTVEYFESGGGAVAKVNWAPTSAPTPAPAPTPTPTPLPAPAPTTAPFTISNVYISDIYANTAMVNWTTNIPTDGQVDIGNNSSYGFLSGLETALSTNHSIKVTNLSPGTKYYIRARSRDVSGTLVLSPNFTFTASNTPAPAPTTPPAPTPNPTPAPTPTAAAIISNVSITNIYANTAIVSWTTDVPADSQVDIGNYTSYGYVSGLETTLSTTHAVKVTNLSAGTKYHVRARSRNASGILSLSTDYTFTASAAPAP